MDGGNVYLEQEISAPHQINLIRIRKSAKEEHGIMLSGLSIAQKSFATTARSCIESKTGLGRAQKFFRWHRKFISGRKCMKFSDIGLSPRKVDYLKYLNEQGGTARTSDIASNFGVDPSTITKTIAELSGLGLVSHTPYRGVKLTEEGKRYTTFLVKRHRILSLMFTHYGLTREEACREVSRFESFVSKEAIDRICRAMGHPSVGVCGEIVHDTGCLGNDDKELSEGTRVRERK